MAVDRELRPGRGALENVLVAGATLAGAEPWKEKSGDGISLVDRLPRGGAGPGRAGAAWRGRRTIEHDVARRSDARVARPLRQVHDLRDVLPGLQRHAAVPGAEVRRAAGRALPGATRPSPDASLDYCSGCGICTQVCPQGVHIAEINTQARAKMRERTGVKLRDRLLARPT